MTSGINVQIFNSLRQISWLLWQQWIPLLSGSNLKGQQEILQTDVSLLVVVVYEVMFVHLAADQDAAYKRKI